MTAITDNSIPVTTRNVQDEMIAFGLMTALLLVVPLTGVYPFFVMQALCFALLACAFNLLVGYGGQISLGHGAFFAVGAYTAGALLAKTDVPYPLAVPAAGLVAFLLGLAFGVPALRLRGLYLALVRIDRQPGRHRRLRSMRTSGCICCAWRSPG